MARALRAFPLAALLAACGGGDDHSHIQREGTGTVCPPGGTTLTWDNFGRDFFGDALGLGAGGTGYCNYCHHSSKTTLVARNNAPLHAVFDVPGIIRGHRVEIDSMAGSGPAGTRTEMPPPFVGTPPPGVPNPQPIPSFEQRQNLSIWLACNAPGAP